MSVTNATVDNSIQLEVTKETYDNQMARLYKILLDDRSHEKTIKDKLFELSSERRQLKRCGLGDLLVKQQSIQEKVSSFITSLDYQPEEV